MRRPLRILVPSGWVAEELGEYRSLTHELVVEHVERATPRPAVMVDMATGERLERVTREQNEVLMVHPIAGG